MRLEPRTTKKGQGRLVCLTPALQDGLAAQRERVRALERELGRSVPFVSPLPYGRFKRQRRKRFLKTWQRACREAGYPEFTLVLADMLRVETQTAVLEVRVDQAVHMPAGDWVRYSTREPEGAEYVSVCVPAFSPHTVHRDS
jgi:hypothetical protein